MGSKTLALIAAAVKRRARQLEDEPDFIKNPRIAKQYIEHHVDMDEDSEVEDLVRFARRQMLINTTAKRKPPKRRDDSEKAKGSTTNLQLAFKPRPKRPGRTPGPQTQRARMRFEERFSVLCEIADQLRRPDKRLKLVQLEEPSYERMGFTKNGAHTFICNALTREQKDRLIQGPKEDTS